MLMIFIFSYRVDTSHHFKMCIDNVYGFYLCRDHRGIFLPCAETKSMRYIHVVILMTLISGE